MKSIRLFFTTLFISAFAVFAYSQNLQISGTVLDDEGFPLIGAAVKSLESSTIVVTNADGHYNINASSNGSLEFSFNGYQTKTVKINGRAKINVTMELDSELLEETIVVGYGSAKKISSVVGAASTVKSKAIENRPVANVADALQGQVSGLQVFTSSGEPSATASMRLRGVNSINASNSPLYVLDGSPVNASIFSSLNPNDIENITVLKDASSTAIYGSRAANGVVYITTKKGSSEKPIVKLNASYTFSSLARYPTKMMNSEEWFNFREEVDPSLKSNEDFQANKEFRLKNNIGTNWRDYIFKNNSPTWSGDLSISGRAKNTDYYISLSALNQEGILPKSYMDRYALRSNINSKITDWLKIGLNLGLSYQNISAAPFTSSSNRNNWNNPINFSTWQLPWTSPYELLKNEKGEFIGYGDRLTYNPDIQMYDYYFTTSKSLSKQNYARINANMYEEFTPIKGLTIRTSQALEAYDWRSTSKWIPNSEGAFSKNWGTTEEFARHARFTSTNTVEYKFDIQNDYHFIILAGQEAIVTDYKSFGVQNKGTSDDRMTNVSNGIDPQIPTYSYDNTAYNSYFANLSFDYKNKYYFDASYRRDGSSLFGANKRYANFWSLGLMWNVKQEGFLKDADAINSLQVRASYGTVGNSGISNYLSYGLVGDYGQYNNNAAWKLAQAANPDLTWETIESFNLGINGRLWNALDLNVEFYNRVTKNLLMQIPFSYATGFEYGWGNAGNMRNRGVDVELGVDILNTKDFFFRASVNFNYNKNQITKLFGGRDEFIVPGTGIKYQVGKTYGDFYYVEYAGVDPANGQQLWYDKDGNITNVYSDDNAKFTGKNRYAPWSGGLQLTFGWKGLSLDAFFSGVAGKWLINNDRYFTENSNFSGEANQTIDMLNMWTTPGQITDIPAAGQTIRFDTHLLENASFLRLKNLQISYNFPQSIIKKTGIVNGIKVYAAARNLFTITKYKGWDPEPDTNLTLGAYPNSKQFSFGIELNF